MIASLVSTKQLWPTTKRMPRLILSLLPMLILKQVLPQRSILTVIWMVNGVDELILAFKPGKLFKEHMITDIYTISMRIVVRSFV